MTDDQKRKLEQKLWDIANTLRGKMNADEFRDDILGFIFYKYLSEKQHLFANKLLETEDVKEYTEVTDDDEMMTNTCHSKMSKLTLTFDSFD